MTQAFVDVGVTLDGFVAGPNRRPGDPLGDAGLRMHEWMFRTATLVERLGQRGGETSADDALVRAVFDRAGACVTGRGMVDAGEVGWPEEAPFRAPVFVLTHAPREPWVRPGGTTFRFVSDGPERAPAQARGAAGGRDARLCGGAATIRHCLGAGAVDEITLPIAPLLLGAGLRLVEGLAPGRVQLAPFATIHSPNATHVRYGTHAARR